MIRRYEAVLYKPNAPREASWTPHSLGFYRTVESATRRCETVLQRYTTHETRARAERFPYGGEVLDHKRDRTPTVAIVEAPIRIVPSVGELGWTP